MSSRCLSFHARYRCRHSGVCCRTGWDLQFERQEREAAERLHLVPTGAFRDGADVSFASRRADGACVFLEAGTERALCGIHRAAGQQALPAACRMFPRVALRDARGWTVTLSHFCPTAASLLFEDDEDVQVVDAPASLIAVGPLEGLDAADAIPPLLRDGVLMDLESFSEWESHAIRVLTARGCTPEASVSRLEQLTDELVGWSPGEGELIERVRAVVVSERPPGDADRQACPVHAGAAESRAVQRWLAAHLFGNWIAYQGRGLRTIVRYVRACLDVCRIELARDGNALEAIRRSDYLIVHESDSQQLAASIDGLARRAAGGARCEARGRV
jgi:Fe-S-cluster containining protein